MTTQPGAATNPHIQIYWSPMCAFCWKVKWLLNRKGVPYEQTHVGDDDTLFDLEREGKLDALLGLT